MYGKTEKFQDLQSLNSGILVRFNNFSGLEIQVSNSKIPGLCGGVC